MDRRGDTKWDRGQTPKQGISEADKVAIAAFYEAECQKGRTSNEVLNELSARYGRVPRQIQRYISDVKGRKEPDYPTLERHWEDLRQAAGQIESRIRVGPDEEERLSVTVPRPKGPREQRLWEDLRTHTPDHEAWVLLDDFRDQSVVFRELASRASDKAKFLRKNGQPTTQCLREAQRAVVGQHMKLRELYRRVMDPLASLQVRHEFHGIRCPDCPGQTLDRT